MEDVTTLSIGALRRLIAAAGLSDADCLERADLEACARRAQSLMATPPVPEAEGPDSPRPLIEAAGQPDLLPSRKARRTSRDPLSGSNHRLFSDISLYDEDGDDGKEDAMRTRDTCRSVPHAASTRVEAACASLTCLCAYEL
jgi:hypothetical protein